MTERKRKREHFCIDDGRGFASEPLHYRECGLDNIYLLNGFHHETVEGEEYVTIEDMDGLWKAIGLHLVEKRKTFSPQEVRFLRLHMDMTQAELAEPLRVSDQTVARWEKGETGIPGPADFALRTAFLLSPVAQPEGKRIVDELLPLMRRLAETDDVKLPSVSFSHQQHEWREKTTTVA
jgi:DNA-binding transcriptional regulator YiaG